MENERLMSLAEVGRILGGRCAKSVRRMIADGVLPQPVYIGRTPMLCMSDVAALIEKLKQQRRERV